MRYRLKILVLGMALVTLPCESGFAIKLSLVSGFSASGGIVVNTLGPASDNAYSSAVQSDGKIVAVGASFNGKDSDMAILRYLPDGRLDPEFGDEGIVIVDSGMGDDKAYGVGIQVDGKILIVGSMSNGQDLDFAVVRLNKAGKPDRSFGHNGIVTLDFGKGNDVAYSVNVQRNGRILVCGSASNGSDLDFALARFDSTGTLDVTFGKWGRATTGLGLAKGRFGDERGYGLAMQTDGKIVMAGFSQVGDSSVIVTSRYLSNGSLDPYFGNRGIVISAAGPYKDFAYSVAVAKDGKILVGGSSSDGTSTRFALLRLTTEGKPDNSFGRSGMVITSLGDTQDIIYSIALEPSGKIVAAGVASEGDRYRVAVVRLTAEGRLDTEFGGKRAPAALKQVAKLPNRTPIRAGMGMGLGLPLPIPKLQKGP